MSKTAINDLQALIRKLQDQRQAHLDAIADIDAAFGSLGIKPLKRRGRPRGVKKATAKKISKAKKVRRRKKFKTTANELVLATIKKAGAEGATGAQISKAWRSAGRPGDAYNTLNELAKAKKIKRNPLKGQRGSMYVVG
ncbi:MAG: hypothetical protein ABII12_06610 [Planctomycetota bacterium]